MMIEELKPGSFIYRLKQALTAEFCETVIQQFESSPEEHRLGQIGQQGEMHPKIKKTTDIRITGVNAWEYADKTLFSSLQTGLSAIAGIHPYFASNPFKDTGYHLQRYQAGEYYHWHVDSGPGAFSQRQLVAIWYLNEVDDGGDTDFYFQTVSVNPGQGDLLLFPPFWTHLHRGSAVGAGVKYIATTWVCFQ